jgi:hypothetical protein
VARNISSTKSVHRIINITGWQPPNAVQMFRQKHKDIDDEGDGAILLFGTPRAIFRRYPVRKVQPPSESHNGGIISAAWSFSATVLQSRNLPNVGRETVLSLSNVPAFDEGTAVGKPIVVPIQPSKCQA